MRNTQQIITMWEFMLYCSFGNGLRLTSNDEYKQVLLQGAESLSTRFSSTSRLHTFMGLESESVGISGNY